MEDQNEKGFQGNELEEYYEDSNSKIYLQFQWPPIHIIWNEITQVTQENIL